MPLPELLATLRWWVALMLIGFTAVPLTYTLFRHLPDKGYAFSKMVGLLLISYLFWLMASFGFVANSLGGIAVGVLGLVIATAVAHYTSDRQLWPWLKRHLVYILTAEIGFTLLFLLWVWVRANNPAITATEKPMEFLFLNAASRSPSYPPLDPWLSGFAISYYYFGYVMMSVLARLSAVPEMIAFNLGMAWLVAGSGLGAFGIIYNLISTDETETEADTASTTPAPISRLALTLALVGMVALPIAGNGQMLMETLYGSRLVPDTVWAWLDIRDLAPPAPEQPRYLTPSGEPATNWWWWRSSRVIREYHLSGRIEDGLEPIAEFPGFSFVLGDMHPHVLALPFIFLSLAAAYLWYLSELRAPKEREEDEPADFAALFWGIFTHVGWVRWVATAVLLGGLAFLNTWDVPIHLFIIVGAFALGRWRGAANSTAPCSAKACSSPSPCSSPPICFISPSSLASAPKRARPTFCPC
jgi:YYY domain-containing protein